MAVRGKPFAVIYTPDPALFDIQRRVSDVFDQLEDSRRGTLVSSVLPVTGSVDLAEQMVVVYGGHGGHTIRLPKASLRGSGRGQVLLIANQGTGTFTLKPSGNDTLNGATSIPVNATCAVFSDGASKWHVCPAGILSVPSTRSLTSTANITLDGTISNTVDLSANRTIGLANTISITGDITSRRPLWTQGTATVAGDYALSAGWGNTASAAVATNSRDSRGQITVTSAGVGQAANPTVTFTFKNGAYAAAPFGMVRRNGGTGAATEMTWTTATTTMTMTYPATPVATLTYIIAYTVAG